MCSNLQFPTFFILYFIGNVIREIKWNAKEYDSRQAAGLESADKQKVLDTMNAEELHAMLLEKTLRHAEGSVG
jgi:hypothetical protein